MLFAKHEIMICFITDVYNMQDEDEFSLKDEPSMSSDTVFPVYCGKCPKGYYGDGVQCKPRCVRLRCKHEIEYCSAPDTCTRKYSQYIFEVLK